MNRRSFLALSSIALPLMAERQKPSSPSKLGIATTSYMIAWRPKDTMEFLEHCHKLGAGGIQSAINGDIPAIRKRADEYGMYIEAMVPMPHGDETAAFERSLKDAQAVGAVALRSACLGTRRYEAFKSLDDWRAHVAESHKSLAAARAVLDKYKIPLGVENHKDWTADELVSAMKQYGTEYLGVCLDFGNNLSLLDDPMDVIEKLAPFTISTHLKNMGTRPDSDGLLLSEVLLGDGYLDLPRAIGLVRQARPNTRFSLEMISRDPLKVPCLADEYWVTFPDRNGLYLARSLRFANEHASTKPLPTVSQLSPEEQIENEDDNVIACLQYANEKLGFAAS
ncbi:MAG: xylose isomerase [Bryobacterales bacterium]|jgi:3-oxoisoapionate decarboxylase|nr:xylose isomerase [Bryobacterales bacterium]